MSTSTLAGDVPREAVRWLWRDRIPAGMITLVAGRPGQGKSMFAAHVAADLTRGRRNVIFVASEDPLRQVVRSPAFSPTSMTCSRNTAP